MCLQPKRGGRLHPCYDLLTKRGWHLEELEGNDAEKDEQEVCPHCKYLEEYDDL